MSFGIFQSISFLIWPADTALPRATRPPAAARPRHIRPTQYPRRSCRKQGNWNIGWSSHYVAAMLRALFAHVLGAAAIGRRDGGE